MEHELTQWGDHWECSCGEWAAWSPETWADHAEEDPE